MIDTEAESIMFRTNADGILQAHRQVSCGIKHLTERCPEGVHRWATEYKMGVKRRKRDEDIIID